MKVLAIADRPPTRSILETVKNEGIELIITLGDLDFYSLRELEMIIEIPKIGVYGNHDSGTYFESLGIKNLHLEIFEYGGLKFGGFEGSHKYKESSHAKMYTQEEASELMEGFGKVDVLITHSPPLGINDEPQSSTHQGLLALKDYLEEEHPKYLLHGHTYPTEANLVTRYEDTEIMYIYQDKVIEL